MWSFCTVFVTGVKSDLVQGDIAASLSVSTPGIVIEERERGKNGYFKGWLKFVLLALTLWFLVTGTLLKRVPKLPLKNL